MQRYAYVPGCENVVLKVAFGPNAPESQIASSLVAVWSTGSLLLQVIDCPAEIVIVAGTKANLAMLTAAAWPC